MPISVIRSRLQPMATHSSMKALSKTSERSLSEEVHIVTSKPVCATTSSKMALYQPAATTGSCGVSAPIQGSFQSMTRFIGAVVSACMALSTLTRSLTVHRSEPVYSLPLPVGTASCQK